MKVTSWASTLSSQFPAVDTATNASAAPCATAIGTAMPSRLVTIDGGGTDRFGFIGIHSYD
jgi:hypothetical protein